MCGIAGFTGFNDETLIRQMCAILVHRGPDSEGRFTDSSVALGIRRLSIIDLETGDQPIHNESGDAWIVFNGEIYNYRELRAELVERGHKFYTKTDTEVILHAYEEYGQKFAQRLNGMFAVAIWDSRRHELTLARDMLGIKPLYYYLGDDFIVFASEVKAILLCDRVKRELDRVGLHFLLNLSWIPGERTMFAGIKKLEPGHMLIYNSGRLNLIRYWHPLSGGPSTIGEDAAAKQLLTILEAAVRRNMISDVPIAAYLSGGLDTSTVVALMSHLSDSPIETFCMGFGESTDELKDAKFVAEHFGTDHHELVIEPKYAEEYPRAIWHADMPKINLYPYFIANYVGKHVKVVLSGMGGDELFGGYVYRYKRVLTAERFSRHPLKEIAILGIVPVSIAKKLSGLKGERLWLRAVALRSADNRPRFFAFMHGALPGSTLKEVYGANMGNLDENTIAEEFSTAFDMRDDYLGDFMRAELLTKMPNDFLLVDDAMSMAHSLEERVPLLDGELVDFALSLPTRFKYEDGMGKRIMRRAMGKILPREVFLKPKWGFSVDVFSWYRDEIRELAKWVLPDGFLVREGLLRKEFVDNVLGTLEPSLTRWYSVIWRALLTEIWHKLYFEGDILKPKFSMDSLFA